MRGITPFNRLKILVIISLFIFSWNIGIGQTTKTSSNPGASQQQGAGMVSIADFDKQVKDNAIVLAEFSATWCRPCRMLSPVIDTLADKNKGKVLVIRIDVDQNKELTRKLQVTELPTILLFKNGKQVWRGEGYMPGYMVQDVIDGKN